MNYFGTNLTSAGHYFWELQGDWVKRSKMWFHDIPFDPETILKNSRNPKASYSKGECKYFHIDGWSIIAIEGSCVDKRNGTKSVFFVNENIDKDELKKRILAIPVARKMIEQMPFKVLWEE